MKLLDGTVLSALIREEIRSQIALSVERPPSLVVLLVGTNPASNTYVQVKTKRCKEVGISVEVLYLPKQITKKELLETIFSLNANDAVDAILVQQPLPPSIPTEEVVAAISPKKDVDGLHPLNLGKLLLGENRGFIPCTPLGIFHLLKHYQIPLQGSHVVIVGRSVIVGKPLAALLSQRNEECNATVTLAHRKTKHLENLCLQADILVAAAGVPHLITKDMVRKETVVIDVGINRMATQLGREKLVGDVAFEEVAPIVSAITPVPGGIGPMTVAMLLQNTLLSYESKKTL